MRVLKRIKCAVALTVLVCFFTVGCIGPMSTSRSLGKWNAEVGNKWGAELVFLGLVLFHVYTITGLIDLLILNPIAFWKAPNSGPMVGDDRTTEITLDKDRRAILTFSEKENTVRADLFERGQWIDSIQVMEKMDGSMAAESSSGKVHYGSRPGQDGIQEVTNEHGKIMFSYSPHRIDRRIADVRSKDPIPVTGMLAGLILP
jgi:hypothetical protein